VLAGLMLTWVLVADKIVLVTAVLPILIVCGSRAYRGIVQKREPSRSCWLELWLAAVALVAVGLSDRILSLVSSHGGFTVWPALSGLGVFGWIPLHFTAILQWVPMLYGGAFFGHNLGLVAGLLLAHLVGLGLAVWAVCAVLRRFPGATLVDQLLAVAILVDLAGYLLSGQTTDFYSAREFVAVLPFGAALAARVLGERLAAARLVPVLSAVLAAYVLSLAHTMSAPVMPAHGQQLSSWLQAHHLDHGLAGYWNASVVTLASREQVQVAPVIVYHGTLYRYTWESRASWYDPADTYADFVVLSAPSPGMVRFPWADTVHAAFGPPARVYPVGTWTVLVWHKNLLLHLP
jgi:hypothetical protein